MSEVENLNIYQKDAIEELRMRMKNDLLPDMCEDAFLLYRFLKARDFDIDKAELMLRKHITWKKVYQVDTFLEDFKPFPAFLKYISGSYIGEDKEGNLLFYSPAGHVDTRDTLKCFKSNDYFRHWIWTMLQHIAQMKEKKSSRKMSKFSYILNLDGLELANAAHPTTASIYLRAAQLYQDNFPETLKAFYVINAPAYYVLIYSIVKRILAAEVVKKVHVYGRDGWKEDILKVVDANVLPAFLGGTRTDPDSNPKCITFINHGGRIPSQYYLSKEDRSFKDKSRVKQITVNPRASHEICIDVKESGSVIQWEYQVASKDIGFGLSFKETEQKRKEILPVFRFETPDGTDTGSYKCQWIGIYIIIFDNTFSWINTKEVSYCIRVMKPAK